MAKNAIRPATSLKFNHGIESFIKIREEVPLKLDYDRGNPKNDTLFKRSPHLLEFVRAEAFRNRNSDSYSS